MEKSVYDMTTRELRQEIRRRTAEANIRIAEYREAVQAGRQKTSHVLESEIQKLKRASTGFDKKGKLKTPEGRRGEIGLGTSYKRKVELQKQLAGLRRFEKKDIDTPEGKRKYEQKAQEQYETFKSRYGDISREEYDDMIDTMNIVKNTLKDYGYEDNGTGYARMYAKANNEGKQKFVRYVEQARNESKGKTAEDILDRVAELLRESGEL